ncbi:lipopolysaccharide transport periplasmic protein LptA [Ramlibacter sp. G-1-2-2]|uniref:Lipopolysaccharide export system protein LptA n=1 Tax=Ramlibacter agri TaxID=2728837 RepID=A0A848GUV9_9BURK|nr:lipopolysaccharide transport periplasmic protein LptA [Ramlibacter agri]
MRALLMALAIASTLAAVPARAEKADSTKPMNVEADALRYDDLNQTSVFTGNVVVTKGTIIIRGAKINVKQDPEGYQFGVVTAAPGQRAFFRQKREGVDEWIEGEGETIEYDGKADRVKFIGRAEMRRYRGTELSDETSGAVITYNNTTEQFNVDGNPGGATPSNPGGRVRATIGPKPGASAPAAPAAPATKLRQSSTLGGEKR